MCYLDSGDGGQWEEVGDPVGTEVVEDGPGGPVQEQDVCQLEHEEGHARLEQVLGTR